MMMCHDFLRAFLVKVEILDDMISGLWQRLIVKDVSHSFLGKFAHGYACIPHGTLSYHRNSVLALELMYDLMSGLGFNPALDATLLLEALQFVPCSILPKMSINDGTHFLMSEVYPVRRGNLSDESIAKACYVDITGIYAVEEILGKLLVIFHELVLDILSFCLIDSIPEKFSKHDLAGR